MISDSKTAFIKLDKENVTDMVFKIWIVGIVALCSVKMGRSHTHISQSIDQSESCFHSLNQSQPANTRSNQNDHRNSI